MLTDSALFERAKELFLEKTGGEPYRSPIPVEPTFSRTGYTEISS